MIKPDNIISTKSAYFYKIKNGLDIADIWGEVCDDIKSNVKQTIFNFYNTEWEDVENVEGVKRGICICRYSEFIPTFAKNIDANWKERKLGYFIVAAYDGYAAIQIHNVDIPDVLLNELDQLDYSTLTTLNNESRYSRISMKNLDGSVNALRARTFEADDLGRSMPSLGASHYVLNSFSGRNKRGKAFGITTSTARIAERTKNKNVTEFCIWIKDVITNIKGIQDAKPNDLLSIFAEYVDYRQEKQNGNLVPSSVLLSIWGIKDKLETDNCDITYELDDEEKKYEVDELYSKLEETFSNVIVISGDVEDEDEEERNDKISLEFDDDKIRIYSDFLSTISISSDDNPEDDGSIERFVNKYGLFNVYFEDSSLIYTQGGLFKNTNLLTNANQILNSNVLKPLDRLKHVQTEKHRHQVNGKYSFEGLEAWAEDSIFKAVEDEFAGQYDHFICDDMKEEWADHIGISHNKVTFFVEKYDDSKDSASSFQVVVAQALKNIGNMLPTDASLEKKKEEWDGKHTTSEIKRWVNKIDGQSIDEVINKWKTSRTNPQLERQMCLVVNFLSIDDFTKGINDLNALDDQKRATTFQRIWLLSSFVNSCIEAGVKPIIYCRQNFDDE